MSLVYTEIGKKNNQISPGLAWIPLIGPIIICARASKMSWLPLLPHVFVNLIAIIIPFNVNSVFNGSGTMSSTIIFFLIIVFVITAFSTIYLLIMRWKMFRAIRRPGWWAIMLMIPGVSVIFLLIAALGKSSTPQQIHYPAYGQPPAY